MTRDHMASRSCWLSVIVPTLNEARGIAATLAPLQPWRDQGVEVLVVDGGSTDHTLATAQPLADQVLVSPAGRAAQMNAGAAMASAPLLWFLHADSGVASGHLETLRAMKGMQGWGFFPVRLSGRQPLLRLVGALMTLRSRLTAIATGDQGMFLSRGLFMAVGGFPPQPLMEDIAISRALRRRGRPIVPPVRIGVDSRRWEQRGICVTIAQMWWLRWRYWRGADPVQLHQSYYGTSCGTPDGASRSSQDGG